MVKEAGEDDRESTGEEGGVAGTDGLVAGLESNSWTSWLETFLVNDAMIFA